MFDRLTGIAFAFIWIVGKHNQRRCSLMEQRSDSAKRQRFDAPQSSRVV